VSAYHASVAAGESGPLIVLTGELDITTDAELSELVTGQLTEQTLHLTIDVSGLDFADTSAIRVFVLAAKTLRERGGDLVLLRPQRGGGEQEGCGEQNSCVHCFSFGRRLASPCCPL